MLECDYYQVFMNAYMFTNEGINLTDYSDINYYYTIWYDTYESIYGDDYVAEYYSEDGENWIMGDFYTGYSNGWDEQWLSIVDIDTFYIKFEFISESRITEEEGAYIDDIEITGNSTAQPNLVYNWYLGEWDYPVVVSSEAGTHIAADSLEIGKTVYVDWSVTNDGFGDSGPFYVGLYLNGILLNEWYVPELALDENFDITDYTCIVNSIGFNEFRIKIDEDGDVDESDEYDNSWGWDYWFYEEQQVEYINISGYVQYINKKTGLLDTLCNNKIDIRDKDGTEFQVLATGYTGQDGYFEFNDIVNTDDIQDGNGVKQDLYFRVTAENPEAYVRNSVFDGYDYRYETIPTTNHPSGSFDTIITIPNSVASPFFAVESIYEGMQKWYEFDATHLSPCHIYLTEDTSYGYGTGYRPSSDVLFICYLDNPSNYYPDDWDRDVYYHELGHRIETVKGFFDTSEGGPHSWNTVASKELAADEGFAHFWSGVVNNSPIQVNTWNNFTDSSLANMENGEFWINDSLEYNFYDKGIRCEGTVASILWDIYDYVDDCQKPGVGGDSLSDGFANIKEASVYRNVDGHHPDDIEEFWEAWFNAPSLGYCNEMQDIWYDRGIFDYVCNDCCLGIRGNVDNSPDEDPNVADIVFLIDFLFKGGMSPDCIIEADVDNIDGPSPNVADIVYLVDYLFRSGPQPPPC